MNEIILSEIQIIPMRPQNGLVAFASCTINNAFRVSSIAIYSAPLHHLGLGWRCVFPTKKLASGKQVDCFFPINRDAEETVTRAIVDRYVELMENFGNIESRG